MVSVVDIIQRFYWFPSLDFLWFPSWQDFLFMVSVVGFLMVSVVAGKHLFNGFRACGSKRNNFRVVTIRDCAGDARARSDSEIVMRSPAAKDPDLTSGLRGFNPGRALFQGNCVCLFLLACCLLLFVFVCFCFLLCLPGEAKPRSRAEKQCYVSCSRCVSVTFPLRFRCVSVARLPVASA